ncbi:hypothetical protein [Dinghuibacter silviterrae]|uniref:Outer membrane protein with beta-barrel domain n=1 Tax=Dinghuibacter silviterrae TaxID=1539049 RepID=A0A4R8DGE8_9BACT|nr:hypothetical protein [Dinghuibacter silviterrae]TDW96713.1 hypothetical protein EDB95_4549 [Dinghuibacter silviterrae]
MKSVFLLSFFTLSVTLSYGQKESEPPIAELGAAINKGLKDGSFSYGPNLGIEFTPIDEWLEIEMDLTPLTDGHSTEWTFDVLFKKPFTLSEKFEFMAGIGPEFSYSKADNTTIGLEIAGDFMYWPFKTKKWGLYLEPDYDIDFAKGNNQSIGLSGGVLIPFR